MIGQGDQKKESSKLVWGLTVKTLLLVASLIYQGTEVNAQNHFQCIKEGYHADPKDCHIYYRCVDWTTVTTGSQSRLTKFEFKCAPGTVFSNTKGNICVHPYDSERPECQKLENDLDSNINDDDEMNKEEEYPYPSWPSSSYRPTNYPSYTRPENPNKEYLPSNVPQQSNYPSYIPPSYVNQVNPISIDSTTYKPNDETQRLTEPTELLTPSVAGISNSDCYRDGFIAHPKDCKKFIRCIGNGLGSYQHFEFTCGEGTLWDSTIEACNHKWAAKNNCFSESTSTQTTLSNQQSTKLNDKSTTILIKPTQSSGYLPPSTLRPPTSKPSQTQSPITSPSTITTPISTTIHQSLTSLSLTPSSSDDITNNNITPSMPSNSDCIMEGFFADPENCRKFYRCIVVQEGQKLMKYEFECGQGTAWDTSIQACNHEYAVPKCESSNINRPTIIPSTTLTNINNDKNEITSEPELSMTGEPETSTKEKPKPFDNVTNSTSSLKPTSTTINISITTPSTTTEDINLTTQSSKSTESSRVTETTIPSEVIEPLSTTSKLDDSTTSNKQPQSSECQEEGFYADPNDCHNFYRCVKTNSGYIKYNFDCAPGTAWDQSILTCNYAHLVPSCDSKTNEIPNSTKVTEKPMNLTTKSKEDNSSFPSISTITSTPVTSSSSSNNNNDGNTQIGIETTTTSENDESSKSTNKDTESTTENLKTTNESTSKTESNTSQSTMSSSSNDKIICNSEGFYPHPTQCDKFYRCVFNGNSYNVYHFDCAPGTIFDPSISICNYPESVYPPRDCSGNSTSSSTFLPSTTAIPSTITSESKTTTQTPTTISTSIDEITTTESTIETTEVEIKTTTTESTSETTEVEITTSDSKPTSTETNVDTTTMLTEEITESTVAEESTTTEKLDTTTSESDSTENTEQTTETEVVPSTDIITTTTTTTESDTTTPLAPCTLGNLTDEQIVLVCPTGFRRHPKYCNMFYQCTSEGNMEIKILTLVCPENTIFDEEKVQCLAESESSQPCNTELSPARFYRQIEKSSTRPLRVTRDSLCPGEGHYPYQKGCSDVFYKCRKNQKNYLQGYLYRCPNDFVYWSVSRRCEKASRLRTCSQELYDKNREEKDIWKNRWELPIEESNLSARMIHF